MKQINLAFIATGFMGTLYARICNHLSDVNIIALHDIDGNSSAALAEELNTTAYNDANYQKMFEDHPEIDAVVITTPEDHHVAPTLTALEAGKHIFLDKPLATSNEDAHIILNALSANKVISMIGYSLRFDPRYVAAKNSVEQGEIGNVISFVARRNMPLAVLERLGARVESPFWVGVHDIDMMRWIAGSNVNRVMAMVTKKGLEEWDINGSYFALLHFENGVIAVLENTWSPVNPLVRAQPFVFKVEGTEGQIMVRSYEMGVTVYREQGVLEPDTFYMPPSYNRYTGVYLDQMAYFLQCLREGKQTDIPLEEGLNGVMAAEAIIKSAAERQEIVLVV